MDYYIRTKVSYYRLPDNGQFPPIGQVRYIFHKHNFIEQPPSYFVGSELIALGLVSLRIV